MYIIWPTDALTSNSFNFWLHQVEFEEEKSRCGTDDITSTLWFYDRQADGEGCVIMLLKVEYRLNKNSIHMTALEISFDRCFWISNIFAVSE